MGKTDYSVGNLQIVFEKVDKTASAFNDLSANLQAIKEVVFDISRISSTRLDKFSQNLDKIIGQLTPLIKDMEGASKGFVALDSAIKQVGVENLSSVAKEIIDVTQKAKQATQEQEGAIKGIENGNEQAILAEKERKRILQERIKLTKELTSLLTRAEEYTRPQRAPQTILGDIQSTKQQIEEAKQSLYGLMQAYKEQFYSAQAFGNLDVYTNIRNQIAKTEETISSLQTKLAQLQTEFGTPFNNAQAAVSALKNELLNVHYATGQISGESVQRWQELTAKINKTTNAVNRALMTDKELVIEEQKAALAANQRQIEYLKAAYGLGRLNETEEQYISHLRELEAEQRRLRGETEKAQMTQEEQVIAAYQAQQSALRQRIAYLEAGLALNIFGEKTAEAKNELKELYEQLGKNENQTKKATSSWKKFLNQIKRVAIYRLIRTALKAVVSTFRDTINAFAQVDDTVNDTMSSLTSSLNIIKLSVGTTILPLLQMIEPIVNQIAMAFADFVNTISQAMSKTGKYTEINKNALQDYRKQLKQTQGSLLDFDKFRVLNQQEGQLTDFLLPDQDVDESNEHVKQVRLTIESLKKTIEGVWNIIQGGWHTIQPILTTALRVINDTIIPAVSTLVDWLGKAVHWLDEVGLLEPILYTIVGAFVALKATKIINWIKDLTSKFNLWYLAIAAVATAIGIISNWDNFSKEAKTVITVVSSLIAVFTGLAVAVLACKSALTAGIAVPLIVTAVAAGAVAIRGYVDAARGYAQGGLPDKGTMFYAGENGAEMVYNMPSGQSGVANISQIQQAMYNALVQYGRENEGRPIVVNANVDGQTLFRAVEREAGKHGLGFALSPRRK